MTIQASKRYNAFVLLSGGIDSSTCMAIARQQYGGDILAISMDYGQRHIKEADCAKAVAAHFGADHMTIKLGEQPASMLTDPTQEVPNISYDEIKGVSPTYVPFRNGQMLSRLAGIAHAFASDKPDEVGLYFGAHAEDARAWAYPDCTPEFIGAMANAIFIGTYYKVRLHTPLQWLNKKEIIQKGNELGVPWYLTWSCYKGQEKHCGVCPTCRSRRQGFIDAGIFDPTDYEHDIDYHDDNAHGV